MKNVYATAGLVMMLVILASEVKRVDPFIVMMLFCIGGAVLGVVAFRNSTFCVWLTGFVSNHGRRRRLGAMGTRRRPNAR